MILRCTAKLLRLLGTKPERTTVTSGDDWYANLLWIDRRKGILLTHAGTLFSVFTPDVRRADVLPIGQFAVPAIQEALVSEDLPTGALGHLDRHDVWVAPTASRRVIGFMADMGYLINRATAGKDAQDCDIREINRALQRHLHRTGAGEGGYEEPIDAARAWAARTALSGSG